MVFGECVLGSLGTLVGVQIGCSAGEPLKAMGHILGSRRPHLVS